MNDFIKQQQELAREKATIKENPIEDNGELIDGSYAYFYLPDLDTLITQTITNTGEELLQWLKDEMEIKDSWMEQAAKHNKTIDTLKQHITSVTGAE